MKESEEEERLRTKNVRKRSYRSWLAACNWIPILHDNFQKILPYFKTIQPYVRLYFLELISTDFIKCAVFSYLLQGFFYIFISVGGKGVWQYGSDRQPTAL